jgi:ABC-type bacteriocin/lantibiotic exporter with double-glycine peptidase domain
VSDALPEGGAVPDVETLIGVLENLHFRAIRCESLRRELADPALPGLLARADGDVWVIIESEQPGRYKVFQGRPGRLATVGADGLNGQIYLIQGSREEAVDSRRNRLWWLAPLLRGERHFVRRLCGLSLLINGLALALPLYVLMAFDMAAGSGTALALTALSGGMALVIIMEMLLRDLRARSLACFAARLHGRVMETAFERMMALPVQVSEKASAAGLLSRLRSFEAMRDIFASPLPAGILDLPLASLFVAAAFAAGGWLGWLVALAAVALGGLSALAVIRMRLKSWQADLGHAQMRTFRNEMIAKLPVIQGSDAEEIWERRYGALVSHRLSAEAGTRRVAVSGATMAQATAALTVVLILGFGANEVVRGELSAGALMALLVIVWRLATLFRPILLHTGDLVLALHIAGQFRTLMRFPQEISRPPALPHEDISGRIELANAGCRRTGAGFPVVRKITMTADSGELVAVTGPPGAGQSTLMRLLANLYRPDNGGVRIDGVDARQFDARRLRQRIALVSADQRLFAGSAAYNFRLVNPFADDDRIMAAIRDADLEEFFDELEDGVATDLTGRLRNGLEHFQEKWEPVFHPKMRPDKELEPHSDLIGMDKVLSPAVRSKLRLARAYVQDAAIYLFDEPLKDLDMTGRRAFLNKLAGLMGKKTVVVATSDDDILNLADKVAVMKAGEIVKHAMRLPDNEDRAGKSLRSLLEDHQATAAKRSA